jgi:hypothetical protein
MISVADVGVLTPEQRKEIELQRQAVIRKREEVRDQKDAELMATSRETKNRFVYLSLFDKVYASGLKFRALRGDSHYLIKLQQSLAALFRFESMKLGYYPSHQNHWAYASNGIGGVWAEDVPPGGEYPQNEVSDKMICLQCREADEAAGRDPRPEGYELELDSEFVVMCPVCKRSPMGLVLETDDSWTIRSVEANRLADQRVEIRPDDIRWEIELLATGGVFQAGKGWAKEPDIELQWGWTAGMTEEELENYADDAPRGHDSVKLSLDSARRLRDKLDDLLKDRPRPPKKDPALPRKL